MTTTATIDAGNTAWVLVSSALVMLMTPGLAFFYGGGVRHKNVLNTMMMSFVCMGIVAILWTFFTYGFAFGPNTSEGNDSLGSGIFGNPSSFYFFHNVGAEPNPSFSTSIPHTIFAAFQLMFAIITPALITGALAERVSFGGMCLFTAIWHIVIYCPIAHMVWHPSGLIKSWSFSQPDALLGVVISPLDFAGGMVVHMSSGWAAFICSFLLGPRKDIVQDKEGSNISYILLGTALLWFGWFGFNAGSALGANTQAAHAFYTTNVCAASAMLTWMLCDGVRGRKLGVTGACCGAVVGLVVITPACAHVTAGSAIIMGIFGTIVCYSVHTLYHSQSKVEDIVDVFPCHGVGGTIGTIMTACFANKDAGLAGYPGLFYGGGELFWKTIVTVILVVPFFIVGAAVVYFITDAIIPMRASLDAELMGLDASTHGERWQAVDMESVEKLSASLHGGTAGLSAEDKTA